MFQSHLGSISTHVPLCADRPNDPFQSHLGSISTFLPQLAGDAKRLFQSHLGSISTQEGVATAVTCLGFNPTLVRLAPFVADRVRVRRIGFNPTLVRLAPNNVEILILILPEFQSHLGSISTSIIF